MEWFGSNKPFGKSKIDNEEHVGNIDTKNLESFS